MDPDQTEPPPTAPTTIPAPPPSVPMPRWQPPPSSSFDLASPDLDEDQ